MTIGFFDSGLGGLLLMEACRKEHAQCNYIYLGDIKNLPYGPKATQEIYDAMTPCLTYLFEEQNCDHVVVACNTASVKALSLFLENFPQYYERCHGITQPTLDFLQENNFNKTLCLATITTINSRVYEPYCTYGVAMPGLVSLIEESKLNEALASCDDVLQSYPGCSHILLACTHYLWLKDKLKEQYPDTQVFGQDEIINPYVSKLIEKSTTNSDEKEFSAKYFTTSRPELYEEKYGHKFILCDIT